MSNNKLISAPNFTAIPNIILDYWMFILTGAEFKILLCICRKTFGWHKARDRISIRQIEKMTSLSRPSIVKCIEKLIEYSLVTKIKSKDEYDGSDAPNQYEINVFEVSDRDENDSENIEGSKLSLPGVVNSVNPPLVNSVNPQKKDITKENKQKNTPYPLKSKKEKIDRVCKVPSSSKAKKEKVSCESFGSHVELTKNDHLAFCTEHGAKFMKDLIQQMNDYCLASKPDGYKDYAAALRSWINRRKTNPIANKSYSNQPDRRVKNLDGTNVINPWEGVF